MSRFVVSPRRIIAATSMAAGRVSPRWLLVDKAVETGYGCSGFWLTCASLRLAFGDHFLKLLVVTYAGVKGCGQQLVVAAILPMCQAYGISGVDFQLTSMIARTPWAAKGLIGVLSDCFPIGRYHKRGYLLAAALLGISGLAALIAYPSAPAVGRPVASGLSFTLAILFMLPNLQAATFDLLMEGKYAEIMRREGSNSEVLTLVWVCVSLGSLVGAGFIAISVDLYGARPLLALSAVPCVYAAWLTYWGSLPEVPIGRRARWQYARSKLASEPWLFFLATCMALGAIFVALAAGLLPHSMHTACALGVAASLTLLSFRAMPRQLAKANLYMFLVSASNLDLSGPLTYYYTAGPECVADGPGFSMGYYLTVSVAVGAIGGSIGSFAFSLMQSWSFRAAFRVTTFVSMFASLFDIVILKRWNLVVGVSDQMAYIFGDAACQQLAAMLAMMPAGLLTSRLCPRGAEATVFAILAGFQNFGQNVSSILGVGLTQQLNIVGCDFAQLPGAIVCAHLLLPMLCIGLTPYLVPDALMDDAEAFDSSSPPPSFASPACSPAASPFSSPRGPPHMLQGDGEDEDDDGWTPYQPLPSDGALDWPIAARSRSQQHRQDSVKFFMAELDGDDHESAVSPRKRDEPS